MAPYIFHSILFFLQHTMKPMRSLYFCSLLHSEHLEYSLTFKKYKKVKKVTTEYVAFVTAYEIEKHERNVFPNVNGK